MLQMTQVILQEIPVIYITKHQNTVNCFFFLLNCPECNLCLSLYRKILLPAKCFRCRDLRCHQDRTDRLEEFMILEHRHPFGVPSDKSGEPSFIRAVICATVFRFRVTWVHFGSCDQFWCRLCHETKI
uniref:Uncharacterized protein n=1 Tax=Arundo donax TaxID=35708 RepID=A0A0A8XPW0_ARUDO